MLNTITIQGRLTRNPELRHTEKDKAVTNFTLACERDFAVGGEKVTDFIEFVAWGNTALFVCKYFRKGNMAVVKGRLQIRQYTDKDGNKRTAAEVVAENVYFGGDKSNAPAHESGAESPVAAESPADYSNPDNLWDKPVDDLPLPWEV